MKIDIVAIVEENSKEYKQRQPPEFEQHSHPQQQQQHRRFLPLRDDNFYNCELCGVGIAVLQIVTGTPNDEEQFKICSTCLKEHIDQVAAKK